MIEIRELILLSLAVVGVVGLFNVLGGDVLKTGLLLCVAGVLALATSWLIDGGDTASKIISLVGGV